MPRSVILGASRRSNVQLRGQQIGLGIAKPHRPRDVFRPHQPHQCSTHGALLRRTAPHKLPPTPPRPTLLTHQLTLPVAPQHASLASSMTTPKPAALPSSARNLAADAPVIPDPTTTTSAADGSAAVVRCPSRNGDGSLCQKEAVEFSVGRPALLCGPGGAGTLAILGGRGEGRGGGGADGHGTSRRLCGASGRLVQRLGRWDGDVGTASWRVHRAGVVFHAV